MPTSGQTMARLLLFFFVGRADSECLGEYQDCPNGSCSLFECSTSPCAAGEYRCPISDHCVESAAALVSSCPGLGGTHLDPKLSVEERLDYLVNAANLTQMISQLTNKAPSIKELGIPSYNWDNDDEHGVRGTATTYFPDGPGLGASWSKQLLYEVGRVVGLEARAQHNEMVHTLGLRADAPNGGGITIYGPNMNLVRDPRWGRAQEVYSEDPRLSSALTVGYVTGIQGAQQPHVDEVHATSAAAPPRSVYQQAAACCKHYVAYDIEGNGPLPSRVYQDSQVSTRNFWETYMPTFDACVNGAGAAHVMCSYNAMNGVPTCADANLLDGVLRGQWEWDGFVVSDYDAWANILNTHHYTPDMEHAAAAAINAGLDQEGGGTSAISHLHDALSHNLTTRARVRAAFRRLFRVRIRLGMLDPPTLVAYNTLGSKDLRTDAATALNRRAAAAGMVLLKNDAVASAESAGRAPLLPLALDSLVGVAGAVLVAGPLANNSINMLGNYACDAGNCSTNVTSILDGLRNAGTGLHTPGTVQFVPGCHTTNCTETDFSSASSLAAQAKVTVVVLGLLGWDGQDPGDHASPNAYEREGHDRTSISLAGHQYDLAAALSATRTGTPLVCVLVHGGSIALAPLLASCTAIVDVWYPGQLGGAAFADVLFGRVNFGGRSPQTYYASDESLPPLADMDLYSHNGSTYRHYKGEAPVVPFGFGLSYTTFAYHNATPSAASIGPCDDVELSVDVTNTGSREGDEVVQLYLKTPDATTPAPRVRLADFARVHLLAGQTKRVTLSLTPKDRAVVRDEGRDSFWSPHIAVERGMLRLHVGGGQPDFTRGTLAASVRVTDDAELTTRYRCAGRHPSP